MKYLMVLLTGVGLLFSSAPAMADQAEEEAAIRKAEQEYIAAYNAHDAKAIVETFVDGFDTWAGVVKGKAAAEKSLTETFSKEWKNFSIKLLDEIGIVFITPDVAIYKARYEGSGCDPQK